MKNMEYVAIKGAIKYIFLILEIVDRQIKKFCWIFYGVCGLWSQLMAEKRHSLSIYLVTSV